MARGMELWRPDWAELMKDVAFDNPNASELVQVTRYTAELALAAIEKQNREDYYHNYGAAGKELVNVLVGKPTP